ncbi:UNVERIFIED_CONTAM: hypothetical protein FKN15_044369 [Acipenser sinensis]
MGTHIHKGAFTPDTARMPPAYAPRCSTVHTKRGRVKSVGCSFFLRNTSWSQCPGLSALLGAVPTSPAVENALSAETGHIVGVTCKIGFSIQYQREGDVSSNEYHGNVFRTFQVRTDQPHSKKVSEMEAAHISPELPIRWVVSADRTVEIKEEVTELGCDQANERILQEETPPSSITERGNLETSPGKTLHRCAGCVKTFRESGILNGQQQTGTGKTPYNCHECGADFRHHSTVKHHLRVLKVQLGYPCERQDSEMEPVHIKEELPELDPVHVKEELPELEPAPITEETPVLEPIQVNEEVAAQKPVHIKKLSPVLESAECFTPFQVK